LFPEITLPWTTTTADAERGTPREPERGDRRGRGRTSSIAAKGSAADSMSPTGTTADADRGTLKAVTATSSSSEMGTKDGQFLIFAWPRRGIFSGDHFTPASGEARHFRVRFERFREVAAPFPSPLAKLIGCNGRRDVIRIINVIYWATLGERGLCPGVKPCGGVIPDDSGRVI
jgi:hypothetical protein